MMVVPRPSNQVNPGYLAAGESIVDEQQLVFDGDIGRDDWRIFSSRLVHLGGRVERP